MAAAINILDRPLNKSKGQEINFSSLAQLFSEYVNLHKEIAEDIAGLELRYRVFQLIFTLKPEF